MEKMISIEFSKEELKLLRYVLAIHIENIGSAGWDDQPEKYEAILKLEERLSGNISTPNERES